MRLFIALAVILALVVAGGVLCALTAATLGWWVIPVFIGMVAILVPVEVGLIGWAADE